MKPLTVLASLLIVASAFVSAPCVFAQTAPATHLKVVLFKYIPDAADDQFQKLSRRIKSEFEKTHQGIELELRPLNIKDDKLDLYNTSPSVEQSVAYLLSRPVDQGGFDVAEVDTVVLGDLIEADLLKPWSAPIDTNDWHPAGVRAVTVGRDIYGIPHWLCGHFVFSRDRKIAAARTSVELLAALNGVVNSGRPRLVGRLTGSWNVPS